jgi:ribosome-binding protein aMBF1 (putative translation factor)
LKCKLKFSLPFKAKENSTKVFIEQAWLQICTGCTKLGNHKTQNDIKWVSITNAQGMKIQEKRS